VSTSLAAQIGQMARRSVLQTLRQPAMVIPPVVFPLVLMAINVGGLDAATRIPGFPADSYLDFAIAVPFVQGALFAAVNAGTALARDVETGFLKRLAMTPMQRTALLFGNLCGVLVVAFAATCIYIAAGFAGGMDFKAGVGGLPVLLALSMLISLAFAAIGAYIGLRTGSGEAVQGFFPLLFVALFLSSMSLPRPLIEQDWFRAIATYNPVSYLLEGVRSFRHHGLGRGGPGARLRVRGRHRDRRGRGVRDRAADEAGAHMRRFRDVAQAVAWRTMHNFLTNPAYFFPRSSSRCSSSRRSRAASPAWATCPVSTSRRATRRSSSCSC
jgi:ABC-2 type transport system permease protein